MANNVVVHNLISEIVLPELVKSGTYSSFGKVEGAHYDYDAYALLEQWGEELKPTLSHNAKERIRVVVCDKVYSDGLLEFDLDALIAEVFCWKWNQSEFANTLLIVRLDDDVIEFSWIRLNDLLPRMDNRCMSLRHLKDDLKRKPQVNITLFTGIPGELFLRDNGLPDRVLLNFDKIFAESCIRNFRLAISDLRISEQELQWRGFCEFPGEKLPSVEKLNELLHNELSAIIRGFRATDRGRFVYNKIGLNSDRWCEADIDRMVGVVAYLQRAAPGISQYDLIAKLSRKIAPHAMDDVVQSIAVQYKAMLDDDVFNQNVQKKAEALRDNVKPSVVSSCQGKVIAVNGTNVKKLLMQADDAYDEHHLIDAVRKFGKAASQGSSDALRRLIDMEADFGDSVVWYIDFELQSRVMHDEDRSYVKERILTSSEELQDVEISTILQIAIHYDVLNAAIESIVSGLREAAEAMDGSWMGNDGNV